MTKNKMKGLVVLLLIMIIISIAGTSMAADYTCKVSLLVNNNGEVKKGESITILVKASNIQAGEGIASFNTMLEYDANVFDCTVSGDDDGNWQKQGLVENSLSMTRSDLVANSSDQTIAKIVLKAKSDATVGKQTFKLTKMEFSTGNETFSVADVSTTITITEDTGSGSGTGTGSGSGTGTGTGSGSGTGTGTGSGSGTGTGTGSGSGTGTGTGSGSGSGTGTGTGSGSGSGTGTGTGSGSGSGTSTGTGSTGSGSIKNPSSSSSTIPKTGVTDVLVVGAIIGTVAAVVFYIRYKRAY